MSQKFKHYTWCKCVICRVSKGRAAIIFRCQQWQMGGGCCSRKLCALLLSRFLLCGWPFTQLIHYHLPTRPLSPSAFLPGSPCVKANHLCVLGLRDVLEGVAI